MEERKGSFRNAMIWVAAIVLLLVVLHVALVGGTGHRVRVELAMIRSKGEPVTVADLAAPKIPDAENGAVVYEQAFQMMKSPQYIQDTQAIDKFFAPDMWMRPEGDWEAIAPALDRTQVIVSSLKQAASRPKCQFPVDWSQGAGILFPHYAPMRSVARFAAVDAAAKARAGRMNEAVDSLDMALRSCLAIKDERTLIGLLVQVATTKISLVGLQSLGEFGTLSEPQAKRLYDTLGTIDLRRGYVRAMQGERAVGLWAFEQMANGAANAWPSPAGSVMSRYAPLRNADQGYYLSAMRREVDLARLTGLEIKSKHIVWDGTVPAYAFMSKVMAPVFSRSRTARDAAMAEVAAARTFLALQAYKARYHTYPASLAELKSKLGWKIDRDPFSGSDLVYRPGGKGFVLYSFGEDMKDNGGKVSPSYYSAKPGCDIVWRSTK